MTNPTKRLLGGLATLGFPLLSYLLWRKKMHFLPEVTSFYWASLQRFPAPMEALHKAGDKTQLGKSGMAVHACHPRGRWRQGDREFKMEINLSQRFKNETMSKRKRSCLGWGGTVGEARRGSGLVSSTSRYVNKQITEREEKVKVFQKSPAPPRPSVASLVSLASGCRSSPALSPERGH